MTTIFPFSSEHIHMQPLSHDTYREAARLYSHVFISDEPTTHRHAPNPTQFLPYAEYYVRSLISKNLSFVSLDTRTGEVIGFIFCLDLTDDIRNEGEEMVRFLSSFQDTVLLIDELERRFLTFPDMRKGSVLHVFQIGTDRRYRRCGIARACIEKIMTHGAGLGYSYVIADCTSDASTQAFGSCGFHMAGTIPYDSFKPNGSSFFSGMDGEISLMIRDITK